MDLNFKKKVLQYGKEIVRIQNKHSKALGIELLNTNTLSLFLENYYKFCEENGCKQGCRQLHKKHFDNRNSAWLGIELSYSSVNRMKKLNDSPVLQEWALCNDEYIVVGKEIIDAYKEGMTYEDCESKVRQNRNRDDNDETDVRKNGFSQYEKKLIEKKQLYF